MKKLYFTLLALLLLGCREGSPRTQREHEERTEAETDSLKEDSMRAFYERMERWEMLHGGMSRWESDK
jgi:hypothetical protein